MHHSYETVCAVVAFKRVAAEVISGRRWKEATPDDLLEIVALLHEWIRLLKLDVKRDEEMYNSQL